LPADSKPPIDIGLDPKPATIAITGYPPTIDLGLEKEAERVGLNVADTVALQDANLRKWMADQVVPAFVRAKNGLTLAALAVLVVLDEVNVAFHLIAPGDRIITEKVIMALLGATTVQVGVIAALIARYLFPSRPA
jgi:hypothetical protein